MSSPASSPKVVESADPAHHAHSLDGSTVNDDMLVEKRFGIKVRLALRGPCSPLLPRP